MQPTPGLNENPTVVVCGPIHLDILIKAGNISVEGGTLIVDDDTNSLNDRGTNQAIIIVYDGVHAVVASTIGEDRAADVMVEKLSVHSANVHSIQASWDLPTGSVFVATNCKGRPVIFVQRGVDASTNPTDSVNRFASTDAVLVQGELLPKATEAITSVVSIYNIRPVLNLNLVATVTPALIDRADPLIVNMEGAQETIRRLDITEGIRATDYRAQLGVLPQYCPSVVVLRGDNDCLFAQHSDDFDDDPTIYGHPALKLPEGKIINDTGSGDTFIDTLIAELTKGTSLYDAIPLATAADAAAIRAVSTRPVFARRDKLFEMAGAEDFPAIHAYQWFPERRFRVDDGLPSHQRAMPNLDITTNPAYWWPALRSSSALSASV